MFPHRSNIRPQANRGAVTAGVDFYFYISHSLRTTSIKKEKNIWYKMYATRDVHWLTEICALISRVLPPCVAQQGIVSFGVPVVGSCIVVHCLEWKQGEKVNHTAGAC